jgi:prolyl-tRNA synthetase
MKDAYSFDQDEAGLELNYRKMYEAYLKIFKRCGLNCLAVEADSGVMGGNVSHEFMVPAACGEDIVWTCSACKASVPFKGEESASCPKCATGLQKTNTIEVGHIFKLGTKYSAALQANFLDAHGKQNPVIMGCYGIGVSRLISTIIEQNHDQFGIIWPAEVAPYQLVIIPLDMSNAQITAKAEELYRRFTAAGTRVLLDDRDERAGVKFKDADLTGIPLHLVIGRDFVATGSLEMKVRRTNEKTVDNEAVVCKRIDEALA